MQKKPFPRRWNLQIFNFIHHKSWQAEDSTLKQRGSMAVTQHEDGYNIL